MVFNPKARLCAKNSTATIGIINIACPIPLHTSRPLQRYKSAAYSKTPTAFMLKTGQKHALNEQKEERGKARPQRRGVETSAGHCFDESRLCLASLAEYQHQSSATHSSGEPGDPAAAHLDGPGRRQTSQHMSRTGFTPLPFYNSWVFFSFHRRRDEEIHLLTDSAILDFCSSPSSVTWSAPTFTMGGITDG